MWGVADEVIHQGNWYVLQSESERRVRASREAGRAEALKDPKSALAEVNSELGQRGDHLRYVNDTLDRSVKVQRKEYAELVRANARERKLYVLQRRREHAATVSWTAVLVAVVAALVIGACLGAASNF
jgi:hypothetical protein